MILVVSGPLSVSIHWGSLVPPTCCSSTMYLVMPPLGYSGTCQDSLTAVSDTDSADSARGEEGPGRRRGERQSQHGAPAAARAGRWTSRPSLCHHEPQQVSVPFLMTLCRLGAGFPVTFQPHLLPCICPLVRSPPRCPASSGGQRWVGMGGYNSGTGLHPLFPASGTLKLNVSVPNTSWDIFFLQPFLTHDVFFFPTSSSVPCPHPKAHIPQLPEALTSTEQRQHYIPRA